MNISELSSSSSVIIWTSTHTIGDRTCMIYPQSNGKSGENDGKITEIKTIGRGYNTSEHFRVVILFFCDRLELYPHDS